MPFKALIIGGSGEMGQWCARLLKQAGFTVAISSRKDARRLAESLGAGIASPEDAGRFDVVVLSVPIDVMESVAVQVGPLLKRGSLLMDLSSLKEGPVVAMLKYAAPGAEVLGTHPLFGPSYASSPAARCPGASLEGRTVVLVPTDRCERWLPVMRDVFESAGGRVVLSTAEEHDRRMAIVQGLTHFMYIAWGRTLEQLDIKPGEAADFATPVFGVTSDMAGRVLSQSPELYALIQSGPEVSPVRKAFIEACTGLAAMADSGDQEAFRRAFASAAAHYGDLAGARERSDRLIRAEHSDSDAIRKATGQEHAFSLQDGRSVYGIVRDTRIDDFTLETPSETLVLRYETVTPLSQESLARLKQGTPRIGRDIVVKMPVGADAGVLQWALTKIDGVTGVSYETMDTTGSVFITYRFAVDVRPGQSEEILQRVLKTIWGLGYEVK